LAIDRLGNVKAAHCWSFQIIQTKIVPLGQPLMRRQLHQNGYSTGDPDTPKALRAGLTPSASAINQRYPPLTVPSAINQRYPPLTVSQIQGHATWHECVMALSASEHMQPKHSNEIGQGNTRPHRHAVSSRCIQAARLPASEEARREEFLVASIMARIPPR
jgi:hypothetical protein